ncbi:tetraacyldisaccharide 4'-kinase [Mucilaginibacter mali]|uniref:Tetraacyldisaccharide 4'-kinase n=1 Tax=Mucilaginibacter mali TaxID=2740462 RepID=A0A7D4QV97_9SPHI|nr:tetraacyldisaccharide 4'-kinase [Mucilaginibacter mali]QKJ31609.1 tetraacyldisaccharide 4'-kinase [Mucilaginibacter mali]
MKYLRLLLLPFSLLYGLVTAIRNWCYDAGVFKSTGFGIPIISVGNLDVGGSGKTPMTEYLIRLLKNQYQLASLSRGYGRQTTGFIKADITSTAAEIGDEPAQFKHKFPDVNVTVCENRVAGAQQLLAGNDVIILDDAYQHRAIKPGFSILLFDYQQLQGLNLMLPAGNRREFFGGRKRADVIVISKCPADISVDERKRLKGIVKPYAHQQLFFTTINYLPLQDKDGKAADVQVDDNTTVFLLTGIAKPQPMLNYIKQWGAQVIHHNYPDHHRFSLKNIAKLAADVETCPSDKKIIITTEKDMQRLGEQELLPLTRQLPFYTLPIGTEFLNNGKQQFDTLINDYVRKHTAHRGLH